MAQLLVYLAQDERYAPLLPPGSVETTERLLTAAEALKEKHLKLFRAPWYRHFTHWIEGLVVHGHFLYVGLRKRFVHDEALAALEEGVSQLLVVGAGMDTLSLRLAPRFPQVTFIEIDHPASQRAKLRAIKEIGGAPANLHFVAADLASPPPLDEVLAACDAWSSSARSLVVTEGLLMFLPLDAVDRLAAAIHRATGPGSRWLLSHMLEREDGGIELGRFSAVMRAAMKCAHEPVLWAIRDEELAAFLAERGFRLEGPAERYDLRARYLLASGSPELAEEPLGTLEHLAIAERVDGDSGG